MACSLATVQADACTSGIGKDGNRIQLLQLAAQAAIDWAEVGNPGVDYSLAAILDRACSSGILRMTDPVALERVWAQNLCNME